MIFILPPQKNDHPWIASSTWCPNIIHRCPFDIAYKLLLSWAMAIVIFVIAVLGEDLSHSIQMDVTLGGLVFLYHKSNHAPPLVLTKFKVAKVVLFSSFDTRNKDLELSLFTHILRSTNGENQASFGWTGWVWETIGWRSRLRENYTSF